MSALQQRTLQESYKRRIKKKYADVREEANNVHHEIKNYLSKYEEQMGRVLAEKERNFYKEYQKLNGDLERFTEQLFLINSILSSSVAESILLQDESEIESSSANNKKEWESSKDAARSSSNTLSNVCLTYNGQQDVGHCSSVESQKEAKYFQNESIGKDIVHSEPVYNHVKINSLEKESRSFNGHIVNSTTFIPSTSNYETIQNPIANSSAIQFYNGERSDENSSSLNTSNDYETVASGTTGRFRGCCTPNQNANSDKCQRLKVSDSISIKDVKVPNERYHIKEADVSIQSNISAVVKHFNNPHDFWLQICSERNCRTEQLCVFQISALNFQQFNPEIFDSFEHCLAPMNNTNFYRRCRIIDRFGTGDDRKVKVFFIDYGNVDTMYATKLQLMPESAYVCPAKAIHCTLRGIAPVGAEWSRDANLKFKELAECSNRKIYVDSYSNSKYAVDISVELSLDNETEICDIAKALCLYQLAAISSSEEEETPLSNFVQQSNISSSSVCPNLPKQIASCPKTLLSSHPTSENNGILLKTRESYTHDWVHSQQKEINSTSIPKTEENNNLVEKITESDWQNIIGNVRKFKSEAQLQIVQNHASENAYIPSPRAKTPQESLQTTVTVPSETGPSKSPTFNMSPEIPIERCEVFDWGAIIPEPCPTFFKHNKMRVSPTVIHNPQKFYVNVIDNNSVKMDKLLESMTSLYNSFDPKNATFIVREFRVGMFCCAIYAEDNCWYRVKVIDSKNFSLSMVRVQYVDYGNVADVSLTELRPLTKEFAELPAFAVPCALGGIVPCMRNIDQASDSEKKNSRTRWGKKVNTRFRQLMTEQKYFIAEVANTTCLINKTIVYELILWDYREIGLINDILIDERLASSDEVYIREKIWKKKQLEAHDTQQMSEWDPMSEDYGSALNSYGVNLADIEIATVGYKAQDENYICKFYSQNKVCYRGENCPYEHRLSGREATTEDQQEVYTCNTVTLPNAQSIVLILISYVQSPNHFYAVLPFGTQHVNLLHWTGKVSREKKEYIELTKAMNDYYSKAPFDEDTMVALAPGNIVVAKNGEHWQRARVLDAEDTDRRIQVFFVDMGSVEWVERKQLRSIKKEYISTPLQAVECFLENVQPPNFKTGGKWSCHAFDALKELAEGKLLLCHVNRRVQQRLYVTLQSTMKDLSFIGDALESRNLSEFDFEQTMNCVPDVESFLPA